MSYTLKQAKELIRLARASIDNKNISLKGFEETRGVFVTLSTWPEKQLRGCIGFPEPTLPLKQAVREAARAAAFQDYRFRPVSKNEPFTIEISILTPPEEIKVKNPKEYPKKINIGKDGLIVNYDGYSGLLLPQVFPEWDADPQKALEMTCEKAGLPENLWMEKRCKFYKFQAQVFGEKKPNGDVEEKKP